MPAAGVPGIGKDTHPPSRYLVLLWSFKQLDRPRDQVAWHSACHIKQRACFLTVLQAATAITEKQLMRSPKTYLNSTTPRFEEFVQDAVL